MSTLNKEKNLSKRIDVALAKKDYKKTKDVLLNGIIICTILGIVLSISVLILKPIIFHMGQPEDVVNLAFPYITWVAISLVPLVIFQSFKQFSDGLSLTKISMISTIIANIINVIINYILIYGKLGFPKLELVGAGIGTLVSRISMVIIIIIIIKNNKKTKNFFRSICSLNFSKSISKNILNFWVVSDNLLKGAALNAVQIAKFVEKL